MKEIPILFSTPMVQANLEGRKTMTRRMAGLEKINENPDHWECVGTYHILTNDTFEACFQNKTTKEQAFVKCPYGLYGDLLWVRETFCKLQVGEKIIYGYKSLETAPSQIKYKPSIHMPKIAARIWLQVEEIRVERLNEISEEDSIAEGIMAYTDKMVSGTRFTYKQGALSNSYTAKEEFQKLFISINGKPKPQRERGETGKILSYTAIAWDQKDYEKTWKKFSGEYRNKPLHVIINPWVWVVKYKVLSTTGKQETLNQ